MQAGGLAITSDLTITGFDLDGEGAGVRDSSLELTCCTLEPASSCGIGVCIRGDGLAHLTDCTLSGCDVDREGDQGWYTETKNGVTTTVLECAEWDVNCAYGA